MRTCRDICSQAIHGPPRQLSVPSPELSPRPIDVVSKLCVTAWPPAPPLVTRELRVRVRALRTGDTLGRAAPWWSLPLSPLLFLYFYISKFLNLLHRRHFENRCIVFETLDLENEWIESKNLCSENRWIVFLKSYIFKISGILSFAFAAGCHRFFSPLTLVFDQCENKIFTNKLFSTSHCYEKFPTATLKMLTNLKMSKIWVALAALPTINKDPLANPRENEKTTNYPPPGHTMRSVDLSLTMTLTRFPPIPPSNATTMRTPPPLTLLFQPSLLGPRLGPALHHIQPQLDESLVSGRFVSNKIQNRNEISKSFLVQQVQIKTSQAWRVWWSTWCVW